MTARHALEEYLRARLTPQEFLVADDLIDDVVAEILAEV